MKTYADYLSEKFGGVKMQKLAVDGGFTCPNRDGRTGRGGCSYCCNASFSPGYCREVDSIAEQIARGREFFGRKYSAMRYMAYFQSYTATYGPTERLVALYREAAGCDGVDALIIATRPDCIADDLLEELGEMNRSVMPVIMELGAESGHDRTLSRVGRGHSAADTAEATRRIKEAGMDVGLHLIMGLPGESEEMMLETIDFVNELRPATVKIHQLQVIRGTRLASEVARGEADIVRWSADEYVDFCCRVIERLDDDIAIERFVSQSPAGLLIEPRWGLKNYQFMDKLRKALASRQQ